MLEKLRKQIALVGDNLEEAGKTAGLVVNNLKTKADAEAASDVLDTLRKELTASLKGVEMVSAYIESMK